MHLPDRDCILSIEKPKMSVEKAYSCTTYAWTSKPDPTSPPKKQALSSRVYPSMHDSMMHCPTSQRTPCMSAIARHLARGADSH